MLESQVDGKKYSGKPVNMRNMKRNLELQKDVIEVMKRADKDRRGCFFWTEEDWESYADEIIEIVSSWAEGPQKL